MADPITRDELQIRWGMLMRRVRRYENGGEIAQDNSKAWYRIQETLEEFAGMLVDEVDAEEVATGLREATERIWDVIRLELVNWAEQTQSERAARQDHAEKVIHELHEIIEREATVGADGKLRI
jgi:thiamine pyrophosphate-dependent acetolactate synthase large subunit-like protein